MKKAKPIDAGPPPVSWPPVHGSEVVKAIQALGGSGTYLSSDVNEQYAKVVFATPLRTPGNRMAVASMLYKLGAENTRINHQRAWTVDLDETARLWPGLF